MSGRASWWLITLNNPTKDDRDSLELPPDYVKEMYYQDEIGEKNGILHIQLALNTTQLRLATIKEWLPRAHIEAAQHTGKVKNYCKKLATSVPGTFVHWKRNRQTNEIETENNNEEGWTLRVILLTLAQYCEECIGFTVAGEYSVEEARDLYNVALNHIIRLRPELIDKFTGSRVLPAWIATYRTQINLWKSYLTSDPVEDDLEPLVSQSWMGLPETWDVSSGIIEIKTEDCI